MPTIIPLSLLAAGEVGEICLVAGLPAQTRRLGEMGLRQGARIQMVRRGSPCILRLENSQLCFREGDISHILVRTVASAAHLTPIGECASVRECAP